MGLAGIERIGHTWPDAVFRWLRHRAGVELSIAVLVTAEIIAQVYYAALRQATHSTVLRRRCDQILADEDMHVRFQCERLAIVRARRSRLTLAAKAAWQRFLFTGTCWVVWMKHRRALRAGGLRYKTFRRHAQQKLAAALKLMNPRNYIFGPVADARNADRIAALAAGRTSNSPCPAPRNISCGREGICSRSPPRFQP